MQNIQEWSVVWYEPYRWAKRERWVISSFPPDTKFVFVRYTSWSTAARTATYDLFIGYESDIRLDQIYPENILLSDLPK